MQYTNIQLRADERENKHLKEKKGYQSAWGVWIYSHTSWLESYIKIVWSGHGDSKNWMQVLVRFFLAVKEGAVSMLGIRARRTEKTELSRPVFLYILNCLENAALNAGKHCPSTSNWRRSIRDLTLDPPGKSWLSKQTLTIFSVTSKRKERNVKILDFVVQMHH